MFQKSVKINENSLILIFLILKRFLEERPILRNILYLVTLLLVERGKFSFLHSQVSQFPGFLSVLLEFQIELVVNLVLNIFVY